MRKITWIIGIDKIAGNTVSDGILHYNKPVQIFLDGQYLQESTQWTHDENATDTTGSLNFGLIGGLLATQKLDIYLCIQ